MIATVAGQADVAARIRNAFPKSLSGDVAAVLHSISVSQHPPSTDDIGPICIAGEQLRIPYRFYSELRPNFRIASLEPLHQDIHSCIYTRHHDGIVRQEFTAHLVNDLRPWMVPFLLQLVGEYVCEINSFLLGHLPSINREYFAQFALENPLFIALTCRRVISYWDVYYRQGYPRLTDYPGYRVLDALELWCDSLSPRLLSR